MYLDNLKRVRTALSNMEEEEVVTLQHHLSNIVEGHESLEHVNIGELLELIKMMRSSLVNCGSSVMLPAGE